MKGGGDNWSYKTFKETVKMSPPTNQHHVFYWQDALPVAQPTVSEHWRESMYILYLPFVYPSALGVIVNKQIIE